jgi:dihydroneopterin aldolase
MYNYILRYRRQDNGSHIRYSATKLSHPLTKQNALQSRHSEPPAVDITYLHGLKIPCIIGIWDWERSAKQTVIIDLDMASDVATAAASDNIKDAVDYKAVAKRLQQFVGESEYGLVETLAEHIASLLREEFKLPWVRVRVNKKGAVRGAGDVGVVIERGNL